MFPEWTMKKPGTKNKQTNKQQQKNKTKKNRQPQRDFHN